MKTYTPSQNLKSDVFKWFAIKPPITIEQLKTAFKKKAIELHPDTGGNHAEFIKMKSVYDEAVSRLHDLNGPAINDGISDAYDYARSYGFNTKPYSNYYNNFWNPKWYDTPPKQKSKYTFLQFLRDFPELILTGSRARHTNSPSAPYNYYVEFDQSLYAELRGKGFEVKLTDNSFRTDVLTFKMLINKDLNCGIQFVLTKDFTRKQEVEAIMNTLFFGIRITDNNYITVYNRAIASLDLSKVKP